MQPAIAYGLYVASVVGAVALYLMAPRAGYTPARIGGLLGAAGLGGLWLWLARYMPEMDGNAAPMAYYYVFSGLAVLGAARMITHTRALYSALWFVLVVLATAGLLLVLVAPFMAAAVVIIYAGAILVTYVFVIMLAAPGGGSPGSRERGQEMLPEHERVAREPWAAVAAGFVLLAVLLSASFGQLVRNGRSAGPSDSYLRHTQLRERGAQKLWEARVGGGGGPAVPASDELDNVERVGWAMFRGNPLALELAGVILLGALVGAVVLAGQRAEDGSGQGLEERPAGTAGPTGDAA